MKDLRFYTPGSAASACCTALLFFLGAVLFSNGARAASIPGADTSPKPAEKTVDPVDRVTRQLQSPDIAWPAPVPPADQARRDPVLSAMANSPNPVTRRNAIQGIAKAQKSADIDTILRGLADSDPEVRSAAQDAQQALGPDAVFNRVMDALCKAGSAAPPRAVNNALPYLTSTLEGKMIDVLKSEDDSSARKKVAAYCLGRMQSRAAIPVLSPLTWSPDPVLANVSSSALLAIGSDGAYDCFRKLLTHPSPELRWIAMQGICRSGGTEATKLLCAIALGTTETNLELRKRATGLLGSSNDPTAVPVLIEVLRSQEPLRRDALAALRQLTQQDAGGDAMSWIEWYKSTLPPKPEDSKTAEAKAAQAKANQTAEASSPEPTKSKKKSKRQPQQ